MCLKHISTWKIDPIKFSAPDVFRLNQFRLGIFLSTFETLLKRKWFIDFIKKNHVVLQAW